MAKVILWCPGLHVINPGDSAKVMEVLAQQNGWDFHFITWPLHQPGQAQEGFTFLHAAEAVMAKVAHLRGLGHKVVLAGTSFGGWVAAYAACLLRGEVAGLVLANPAFNVVGNYLRTQLPWGVRHVALWWYGQVKPFRYYIKKSADEVVHHFMPMSFVRDCGMDGYDVTALATRLYCPVFAVTAPPHKEGFLATPHLVQRFCQSTGGKTTIITDDNAFGHGVRTAVSDDVRNALSAMLNAV